jgi:hypothetical protein
MLRLFATQKRHLFFLPKLLRHKSQKIRAFEHRKMPFIPPTVKRDASVAKLADVVCATKPSQPGVRA